MSLESSTKKFENTLVASFIRILTALFYQILPGRVTPAEISGKRMASPDTAGTP